MSPAALAARCLLVVLCGVPVVAHAVRERRERRETMTRFEKLAQAAQTVTEGARTEEHVIVNGSPTYFRMTTAKEPLAQALDAVERECASGDANAALGVGPRTDGPMASGAKLTLERVDRDRREGVGASLCVFRGAEPEGAVQVRYVLAHQLENGITSLFSIATESSTSLEALFPDGKDVPGGDLPGVPRPPGSRRVFAATVEGGGYAVRIYEARAAMDESVRSYDARMAAAGWESAPGVAGAFPDGRLYARGDATLIASFEEHEGETLVSMAQIYRPELIPSRSIIR